MYMHILTLQVETVTLRCGGLTELMHGIERGSFPWQPDSPVILSPAYLGKLLALAMQTSHDGEAGPFWE